RPRWPQPLSWLCARFASARAELRGADSLALPIPGVQSAGTAPLGRALASARPANSGFVVAGRRAGLPAGALGLDLGLDLRLHAAGVVRDEADLGADLEREARQRLLQLLREIGGGEEVAHLAGDDPHHGVLGLVDLSEDVADELFRHVLDVVAEQIADGLAAVAQRADPRLQPLLDRALQDLRQHALELPPTALRLGLGLCFVFHAELVFVVRVAHPLAVVPAPERVKRAIQPP